MSSMSWTGAVLLHPQFRHFNGVLARKRLIILNDPSVTTEPFIVCRTTSNGAHYRKTTTGCGVMLGEQCHALRKGADLLFEEDTWVQFDEVHELPFEQVFDLVTGEKGKILGYLKGENIRAIMNCILKSDDVERHKLSRIREAQKKLPPPGKPRAPERSP